MGDNFLEKQAGMTKKRRAKAVAKRDVPRLINRPDSICDEFTIDFHGDGAVKAGDMLLCLPGQSGLPVDVIFENHLLGHVGVGGGEILLRAIEQFGVGRLEVISHCTLTETAKARLVQE